MHYFITYVKKTGKITGMFRASSAEVLPDPPSPEEAIAEVVEKAHLEAIADVDAMEYSIAGTVSKGKVDTVELEPRFRGSVTLSTDAQDRDGDGKPELPADGKTSATVRATLQDRKGKPLTNYPDPVRFRVTRGTLGQREVKAKKGVAETAVASSVETTECEVTATAPGLKPGRLTLEFIPVDEFRAISGSH